MGARKKSAPRRGSLGFSPRKRASRLVPRVKTWPQVDIGRPILLGFVGYKAGMTHAYVIEDRPGSPLKGQEVFTPVTVIETPPVYVFGIRLYGYDPNIGRYTLSEAWAEIPRELELERKIKTIGGFDDSKIKRLEELLGSAVDVRVLIATQPKLAGGLSKKKPDVLEVKVGGVSDVNEMFNYAREILGKTVPVSDVFSAGQLVDVIAVTRGKGFQGPVKRWGVKELPRWHKHRKGSRRVGSRSHGRGTWWEIPQAGQTGYHRRTEYNKRVLLIGENGYEVTPAGGFLHYGIVRSQFMVVAGTIPGVPKRPVVIRWPVRTPRWYLKMLEEQKSEKKIPEGAIAPLPPKITYLSLQSKQGN